MGTFYIKNTTSKPASPFFVWMIGALGMIAIALGGLSVWVAAKVAWGESATGKVIEFHHTSSRSVSIVGLVEVTMPNGKTFRDDVDDATGSQNWAVGDTVALRCTQFYANDWSCSADSGLVRFLFPLFFLGAGIGMVWWSTRKIRAHFGRGSTAVCGTH